MIGPDLLALGHAALRLKPVVANLLAFDASRPNLMLDAGLAFDVSRPGLALDAGLTFDARLPLDLGRTLTLDGREPLRALHALRGSESATAATALHVE